MTAEEVAGRNLEDGVFNTLVVRSGQERVVGASVSSALRFHQPYCALVIRGGGFYQAVLGLAARDDKINLLALSLRRGRRGNADAILQSSCRSICTEL